MGVQLLMATSFCPALFIGMLFAFFNASGNIPYSKHLLNTLLRYGRAETSTPRTPQPGGPVGYGAPIPCRKTCSQDFGGKIGRRKT